jgi:archaemetzincin
VRQAIRAFYGLNVDVRAARPLPAVAWYEPRRRYRAERLIEKLAPDPRGPSRFVLGLTASDISTSTKSAPDWGIIGLAQLDGTAGIVSTFRCGGHVSSEGRRVRLAKVAVHEVGHILGLSHCEAQGCLMNDAQGRIATVDRAYDLCAACRARLAATRTMPARLVIPWPRPATTQLAANGEGPSELAILAGRRFLAAASEATR